MTDRFSAVLWDFGGVISSSPFEAFNRHEAARGLPHGFIRGVNARNPDSNAWALLERNEILHDCNLHRELEHHSVLPVVTLCDDAFQRGDHHVRKILSGVLCGEISGIEANRFFYKLSKPAV